MIKTSNNFQYIQCNNLNSYSIRNIFLIINWFKKYLEFVYDWNMIKTNGKCSDKVSFLVVGFYFLQRENETPIIEY